MFKFAKEVNGCLSEIKKGNKMPYFKDLYDMTAVHLLGVARIYLTDKCLAEDVVSVTYIKALRYINSFNPEQDGYNWLCKTAQNVAYSFNKKDVDRADAENRFAQGLTSEYFEQEFDMADFYILTDGMSETDKKMVYLRFYEGKTYEEIGAQFNISKVAAFQKIRKVLKNIKKILKLSKQI